MKSLAVWHIKFNVYAKNTEEYLNIYFYNRGITHCPILALYLLKVHDRTSFWFSPTSIVSPLFPSYFKNPNSLLSSNPIAPNWLPPSLAGSPPLSLQDLNPLNEKHFITPILAFFATTALTSPSTFPTPTSPLHHWTYNILFPLLLSFSPISIAFVNETGIFLLQVNFN